MQKKNQWRNFFNFLEIFNKYAIIVFNFNSLIFSLKEGKKKGDKQDDGNKPSQPSQDNSQKPNPQQQRQNPQQQRQNPQQQQQNPQQSRPQQPRDNPQKQQKVRHDLITS